jgi:DNA-binding NarL/FixJ family response regulator/multidrug efflux pump subunit AcrA (membrane-fusion protein)
MIRILIVDDQKSVRARLKHLVESTSDCQVVGTAEDGFGAIEQVKNLQPDIVLLDLEMPQLNGLTATRIISQECTGTKILVLSSHGNEEYIAKSISAGATGYLLKGTPDEEIQQAIRFVYKGYTHIGAGLFEKMLPMVRASTVAGSALTPKENVAAFPTSVALGVNQQSKSIQPTTDRFVPGQTTGKWQMLVWLLLALSLTIGIYTVRQWLRRPLPSLSYSQQAATFANTEFTGRVKPAKTFKIAAIAPAVVENIEVQIGEKVEAGQPLLLLKNLEAEAAKKQALQEQQLALQQQQTWLQQQQTTQQQIFELEQKIKNLKYNVAPLRAEIAEANWQVSLAQSQADLVPLPQRQDSVMRTKAIYERALARFNRLETLNQQGAVSHEQLEQAQAELEVAKADLTTARAAAAAGTELERSKQELSRLQKQLVIQEQEEQIRQMEKQLQTARLENRQATEKLKLMRQQAAQLARHQIPEARDVVAATAAGVVTQLPVTVGDRIFTGNSLVELAQLKQMKVEVPVNARLINALRSGQRAIIKVGEGEAARQYEGAIATINPLPAENLNYLVEVQFDNPTHSLLSGQLARVQFLPQATTGGN